MNINSVAKIVGLNSRTIRFYESKGLFGVSRGENLYRQYDEEAVDALKKIRVLRYIGVRISDIRLWRNGILSAEEMLSSRLKELQEEGQANADQLLHCTKMLKNTSDISFISDVPDYQDSFSNEKPPTGEPVHIGLDIGTTTISLVVLGEDRKTVYECYNIPNDSRVECEKPFHRIQNVEHITGKVSALIKMAAVYHEKVLSIGLTGQMHGILYVDDCGKAVSNLYTWQDKCGDELIDGICGKTYCAHIEDITGEKTATGYGIVTHYYLMRNGLIPKNACKLCTIMDYAGMVLTGIALPLAHITNAASLGFFSCIENDFNYPLLEVLGIEKRYIPDITAENSCIGHYKGIPVIVAIGDNQASFIGTVDEPKKSVLVNIGTGSQISMLSRDNNTAGAFELRPFIGGTNIKSYSALCGGHAYSILEQFVRKIVFYATGADKEQYSLMEKLAVDKLDSMGIRVNTTFSGSRAQPNKSGSIEGITGENFTIENLIYGFSEGIVNELYEKYTELPESKNVEYITVSGNGARKNKLVADIIKKVFGKDIAMKDSREEAAIGAAIFAADALAEGNDHIDADK